MSKEIQSRPSYGFPLALLIGLISGGIAYWSTGGDALTAIGVGSIAAGACLVIPAVLALVAIAVLAVAVAVRR